MTWRCTLNLSWQKGFKVKQCRFICTIVTNKQCSLWLCHTHRKHTHTLIMQTYITRSTTQLHLLDFLIFHSLLRAFYQTCQIITMKVLLIVSNSYVECMQSKSFCVATWQRHAINILMHSYYHTVATAAFITAAFITANVNTFNDIFVATFFHSFFHSFIRSFFHPVWRKKKYIDKLNEDERKRRVIVTNFQSEIAIQTCILPWRKNNTHLAKR